MDGSADVVVIGSGPNGLFAACRLARAGLKVLALEAADTAGGGLSTVEATLPGFRHDTCAGFVAFRDTAAFRGLALPIDWKLAELMSTHPAPDGTVSGLSTDLELSARHMGSAEDGRTFLRLAALHARVEPQMLGMLGVFPNLRAALGIGPLDGLRLLRAFLSSSGGLARRVFRTEAARRVIPSMGLHVDIAPDDPLGASVCWMLAFRATTAGFAVPAGGMASIARLLVADLEANGGEVRCGARVARVEVANRRAVGVVLAGGERIGASRGIVADTHVRSLVFDLLDPADVPSRMSAPIRRFRSGWGTFKVDLALSGPVPWSDPLSPRSAVVHVGDSLDDLQRFSDQVRGGDLPDRPYLVIGQQSLVDPTRAPPGHHTLYVYTHAPAELDPARYPGGWSEWRERLADRMEERIEELAPGFRSRVLARAIRDPGDLQRFNANLIGGDMGAGTSAWDHALFLRPTPRWFRHRTPIRGLYLASSSAHPGPGIHGMGGWNAAEQLCRDL